jgi:hypothetical protein
MKNIICFSANENIYSGHADYTGSGGMGFLGFLSQLLITSTTDFPIDFAPGKGAMKMIGIC